MPIAFSSLPYAVAIFNPATPVITMLNSNNNNVIFIYNNAAKVAICFKDTSGLYDLSCKWA